MLSLAALRRLRFPIGGAAKPETDLAARTVLAALALTAVCLLDEEGYDLRSRCLLDGKPGPIAFVGRGEVQEFGLDSNTASNYFLRRLRRRLRGWDCLGRRNP